MPCHVSLPLVKTWRSRNVDERFDSRGKSMAGSVGDLSFDVEVQVLETVTE